MQQSMTPISNPLSPKLEAMLKNLTTPQLTDLYQREAANPSGSLKLTMILGELKNRQNTAKQITEMPTSTVAQDVVQQAIPRPQPQMPQQPQAQGIQQLPPQQPQQVAQAAPGIDNLPVPDSMFSEQSMAGGGIVAFDEGGHVPRYAGVTDGSLVSGSSYRPSMVPVNLVSTRNEALREIDSQMAFLTSKIQGLGGFFGLSQQTPQQQQEYKALQGQLESLRQQRFSILHSADPKTSSPLGRTLFGESTPSVDTTGDKGMPYMPDSATRKALTAQNAATLGIEPAKTPTDKPAAPAAPAAGPGIPSLASNIAPYKVASYTPDTIPTTQAEQELEEAKKQAGTWDEFRGRAEERRKAAGIKDVYEQQMKDIQEEKNKVKGDKEKAGWMSLLEGSLAVMANNSPYALQNIGAGAFKGVNSYKDAIKEINQNEKDLRKEGNALARDQQTALEARLRGDETAYNAALERVQGRRDKIQSLEAQNTVISNTAKQYTATQTTEAAKTAFTENQANARANAEIAARIRAAQISADAATKAAIVRALTGQTLDPLEKAKLNKLASEAYAEYTGDPANQGKTLMTRDAFISQYISNLGGGGGGYTPSGKMKKSGDDSWDYQP